MKVCGRRLILLGARQEFRLVVGRDDEIPKLELEMKGIVALK